MARVNAVKLPRRMLRNGWTFWHLPGALAVIAFGVWMSFPAWRDIYLTAADPEGKARHVFLVPVIAAWLAWVRRGRLMHCRSEGQVGGLLLIIVGGVMFSLAGRVAPPVGEAMPSAGAIMLWHAGAVVMTVGCGLTVLGTGVARQFLPAIVVLIFLVPIPRPICDQLELPARAATLELNETIYQWVGIDAQIDYSVDDPTEPARLLLSGVAPPRDDVYHGWPMVMDLLLVSWAFVFGSPLRWSVRLVILLLSPLSAILCGSLGLMATLWLYGSEPLAAYADLLYQSCVWATLLVAFMLLAAAIRGLAWASVPVRPYHLAYDF